MIFFSILAYYGIQGDKCQKQGETDCYCYSEGPATFHCSDGKICNVAKSVCINDYCKNWEEPPENGCICDTITNVCNQGQICNAGFCISPCQNEEPAPENGCICNTNTNICNQGQTCKDGVCKNPVPILLLILMMIIVISFLAILIIIIYLIIK